MSTNLASKFPRSLVGRRTSPTADNNSIKRLHAFFKRIVDASGENAPIPLLKIAKRLTMSNRNRPAVKISKIVEELKEGENKTAVVVAKVLDDETLLVMPAVRVVALKWSKSVQRKIENNGGSINTLDQFIKVGGSLDNLVLVHGDPNARKASKYMGAAPGEKKSATYPRIVRKCRNAEKRIRMKKPVTYEDDSE